VTNQTCGVGMAGLSGEGTFVTSSKVGSGHARRQSDRAMVASDRAKGERAGQGAPELLSLDREHRYVRGDRTGDGKGHGRAEGSRDLSKKQSASERRSWLLQELQLLGGGWASKKGVAVWESSETADDVAMLLGVRKPFLQP